jgi:predicted nucleotide-binding protein
MPPATVASEQRPRVFVVHGHDDVVREQLELVLHKLGLEPFVLANTGGGGLILIEALEREVVQPKTRARFGIILMTPDDVGYSKQDGTESWSGPGRLRACEILNCSLKAENQRAQDNGGDAGAPQTE